MSFLRALPRLAFLAAVFNSVLSEASVLYRRPAPFNAQLALQMQEKMNETNNVIPGGSPFFYMEDPEGNLFSISSIYMTPSPCHIGLPCSIEARGTFHQDLPKIDLSFDIEARLKDGQSAQMLAVRDDVCEWATLDQPGGQSKCPPRRGAATLKTGMDLVRGWIMEATYFIDLKLMSGDRMLTHVGAMIVLTDPDPNPPGRPVSTS